MKVGDLVRAKNSKSDNFSSNTPIVQDEWVGIVIGFTGEFGINLYCEEGIHPVVYWNDTFSREIEFSNQLEVIQHAKQC